MELEQKYVLEDGGALPRLLERIAALGWSLVDLGGREQRDVYYDTVDFALCHRGESRRLRTCEGKTLFTQKTGQNQEEGLFARGETEYEVVGPPVELDGLSPVLTIDNQRRLYDAVKQDCVLELALDTVYYRQERQEHGPELQAELELKSETGAAELRELARRLADLEGLRPMTESKYQRGIRFLGLI